MYSYIGDVNTPRPCTVCSCQLIDMAAASMKLSLTFILLLSGLVVFGEVAAAGRTSVDCSLVRCIQGGYITCDNYPYQKLDGCICGCAPKNGKNCVLHLQSGSDQQCDTTEQR